MTEIAIHRVNTIERLLRLSPAYGMEIDIRAHGSRLILNHEPFESGDNLVDYLDAYQHGLLILNIKEAGIESEVLRLVRERPIIQRYFLLDVEFPYLYRAARAGERAIAVRYSEDESIETVNLYANRVDWVWIDTISRLPLDSNVMPALSRLKTCLVCPERWGRPHDISIYRRSLAALGVELDAVMTSESCAPAWQAVL